MSQSLLIILGFVGVYLAAAVNSSVGPSSPLGPYKVSSVTVSGISSGASMAVQMHVAYSMVISGAAVFAGGPFYCAEGSVAIAETRCMAGTLGGPDVDMLVQLTYSDARFNLIDDPSNMKNDRVFVYTGLSDSVVHPVVVHALQAYYSYFMDAARIVTSYDVNSEHCLPTLDYGEDCSVLSSPYLGNCNYDGAGAALAALYGPLQSRVAVADTSRLFSFDQTAYFNKNLATSIGDVGYIFVPKTCEDGAECKLHISFHGCQQTVAQLGDAYPAHSGFNEWAETNNIILLYPSVKISSALPYNPNGCWDWWGYTNPSLYGVKAGMQPTFVRSLITAITGK